VRRLPRLLLLTYTALVNPCDGSGTLKRAVAGSRGARALLIEAAGNHDGDENYHSLNDDAGVRSTPTTACSMRRATWHE
jgi:hypothetical protein